MRQEHVQPEDRTLYEPRFRFCDFTRTERARARPPSARDVLVPAAREAISARAVVCLCSASGSDVGCVLCQVAR